jgi:hypothetical protein
MKEYTLSDKDMAMLLAAEASELEGAGDTEIAQRVRTDAGFARAAYRLADDLRDADAAIAAMSCHENVTTCETASNTVRLRTRAPRRSRHFALIGSGLAAALAVLYVGTAHGPWAPQPSITATLNASSSRPFVVLATDNPEIAIVWLLDQETP